MKHNKSDGDKTYDKNKNGRLKRKTSKKDANDEASWKKESELKKAFKIKVYVRLYHPTNQVNLNLLPSTRLFMYIM